MEIVTKNSVVEAARRGVAVAMSGESSAVVGFGAARSGLMRTRKIVSFVRDGRGRWGRRRRRCWRRRLRTFRRSV